MPNIFTNGIDTYYEFHGHGAGLPLVLIHGFGGCTDNWRDLALPLASQRTLLLYDLRGHGRTTAPQELSSYSLPIFAADLAALLQAHGIARAHIAGLSMGGMIAAQFALDFPDMLHSLLLCDTTAGNCVQEGPASAYERFIIKALTSMAQIAEECGFEELAQQESEWAMEHDPHFHERPLPSQDTEERAISLPGYLGAHKAMRERPDLSGRLKTIQVPTLILVGELDDFLPCAQRDHHLIEGSRFVLVRRAGHGTPRWQPPAFQQAVLQFLDDVEKGRPIPGDYEL